MEYEYRNGDTPLDNDEAGTGRPRLSNGASVNSSAANGRSDIDEHAAVNGHSVNGSDAANGRATGNGHASAVDETNGSATNGAAGRRATGQQPLHQVGEARRRQGLSVRCVAQRLNMTVGEVRAQEQVHADMLLSELYRWQSVLEVPLEELLADPQDSLSSRVLTRARMLRVMKTARALRAQARTESEHRLAKLLISQLIEIMPELKEVAAWPTVGHRRTADEIGRIAERPIPDDFMHEAS